MAQRITVESVTVGSAGPGAHGLRASALPPSRGAMTFHAVSRVRLDHRHRVVEVVWGRIDTVGSPWSTEERRAPVADVVAAIHAGDAVFALFRSEYGPVPRRRFIAVAHDDGEDAIAFDDTARSRPALEAMDRIPD